MKPVLLIFSQTFVPDPAAVGQYVADAAVEMARRGHRVRVYASARGYEDPTREYPKRENLHGVDVRRLSFSSFGKKSLLTRGLGTATFLLQCLWIGLTTRNLGGILFSTSPPMIGIAATIVRLVRRVPTAYWAMDLNPDQLIAMGKVKPRSPLAIVLEMSNRFILRYTTLVIALDRFMADRLRTRKSLRGRLIVIPPWPQEEHVEPIAHESNWFRDRHGLQGKFVVMYSGNHSPSNPLTTALQATLAFKDDPDIRFLFVGGGSGKREVEEFIKTHSLPHVLSLPYQPLSDLPYSLSAADAHLVSLGQPMVGIIHPCKVYGAMTVGRPILFLGPRPSHISELLDECAFGLHVPHGDVEGMVQAIIELRRRTPADLQAMGAHAQALLASKLSMKSLCGEFCDALEDGLNLQAPPFSRGSIESMPISSKR